MNIVRVSYINPHGEYDTFFIDHDNNTLVQDGGIVEPCPNDCDSYAMEADALAYPEECEVN